MDTRARVVITRTRPLAAIAVLAALAPNPTLAQDGEGSRIIPSNAVVITGYGTDAAAMSLSSVSVIGKALRLRGPEM